MARAIDVIRTGGMILVRDNEDRENEGDLVCAAEHATEDLIAFMAVHGRGLICQPLTEAIAARLELGPMAPVNTDGLSTAFTVSVDARQGVTTGISAADRARTIAAVIDPGTTPGDLRRPGHVFPLVAREGGVLVRPGHTEAAVDLARLAGLVPSGVICEVLNDDGTMARGPDLEALSRRFDLPLISVADLIAYRDAVGDIALEPSSQALLPTDFGDFRVRAFRTADPATPEVLLLEHPGEEPSGDPPLVRVHSECLTGEALHSHRCDCGPQLQNALGQIARQGGALVYLRQEGRGIGLFEKIRAYTLQDQGLDTIEANLALGHQADLRRFGAAAAVLRQGGYGRVRLLTNNPEKQAALRAGGIEVTERIPLLTGQTKHNQAYLRTKFEEMGHLGKDE
ncbi:3,4-dihydroxy-2-butanone-4-phosphate synthase [Alkalispirochaeta sphaeroplastigenens]|nr:3,4-dihydroxy-2-butanone-4-phosphate synthase [Alkalispirochaeta sphaeroplastigenens]